MKKDTVYTKCGIAISNAESRKKSVIDANKISDSIMVTSDLSGIPREELEERYIRSIVSVCLYQHGYRSVIRGKGYFVNPDNVAKVEYMRHLTDNANHTKEEKQIVYQELMKKAEKSFPEYAQGCFGEDGTMEWELTLDDVLEMLKEDAS